MTAARLRAAAREEARRRYLALLAAGPVLLLALLVGASRCYLGVHYPGDVLVGWGLAVGSVALVG